VRREILNGQIQRLHADIDITRATPIKSRAIDGSPGTDAKTLRNDRMRNLTLLLVLVSGLLAGYLIGDYRGKAAREALRKSSDLKAAAWRHAKDGLDKNIRRSAATLAASDGKLQSLVAQRDAAAGADQARLELEIGRLRKERDELRREIEGSACLQARVPHSVFDALSEANAAGRQE
jgi:hypothetical protein